MFNSGLEQQSKLLLTGVATKPDGLFWDTLLVSACEDWGKS